MSLRMYGLEPCRYAYAYETGRDDDELGACSERESMHAADPTTMVHDG